MKDMKMSPSETLDAGPTVMSGSDYPYGLRITLDEQALKKIEFNPLPAVGQTMILQARVRVTDVSAHEGEDGTNRSVSFQITDLEFETDNGDEGDGEDPAAAAGKLFTPAQNTVIPPPRGQLYH